MFTVPGTVILSKLSLLPWERQRISWHRQKTIPRNTTYREEKCNMVFIIKYLQLLIRNFSPETFYKLFLSYMSVPWQWLFKIYVNTAGIEVHWKLKLCLSLHRFTILHNFSQILVILYVACKWFNFVFDSCSVYQMKTKRKSMYSDIKHQKICRLPFGNWQMAIKKVAWYQMEMIRHLRKCKIYAPSYYRI